MASRIRSFSGIIDHWISKENRFSVLEYSEDDYVFTISLVAVNGTFLTVYVYIYIKFRRANQEARSSLYGNRNRAKFFTPFIICGTFFIFATLPCALFNSLIEDIRYTYLGIYLDAMCNSIVYIFLNENVVNRIQRWKTSAGNNNLV